MIIRDTPQRIALLFSEQEILIMRLICEENTSKEIAHALKLSKRTIESHRTRLMDKTGSSSVVGIVVYAIANEIFDINQQKNQR